MIDRTQAPLLITARRAISRAPSRQRLGLFRCSDLWWRALTGLFVLGLGLGDGIATGWTQTVEPYIDGTGVTERLGAELPLETRLTNHEGQTVRLGDYFGQGKPVLISFNYTDCPGLCSLQLTGMAAGLTQIDARAGRDYTIVSIGIDPNEPWTKARDTRSRYTSTIRSGEDQGWNFLVGKKASIDAVAEAVGFRYKYIPRENNYSHPAVLVACTEDGHVSGYLYDVHFKPNDLNRAITQARAGESRSLMMQVILNCFHMASTPGDNTAWTMRITMLAGFVTVLAILVMGVPAWLRRNAVTASATAVDRSSSLDDSTPSDDDRDDATVRDGTP